MIKVETTILTKLNIFEIVPCPFIGIQDTHISRQPFKVNVFGVSMTALNAARKHAKLS